MTEPAGAQCATAADHCITCGDEGVEMRVLHVAEEVAWCIDGDQAPEPVAVELVAPVAPGDGLLVHAGVAIRNLGPGQ